MAAQAVMQVKPILALFSVQRYLKQLLFRSIKQADNTDTYFLNHVKLCRQKREAADQEPVDRAEVTHCLPSGTLITHPLVYRLASTKVTDDTYREAHARFSQDGNPTLPHDKTFKGNWQKDEAFRATDSYAQHHKQPSGDASSYIKADNAYRGGKKIDVRGVGQMAGPDSNPVSSTWLHNAVESIKVMSEGRGTVGRITDFVKNSMFGIQHVMTSCLC